MGNKSDTIAIDIGYSSTKLYYETDDGSGKVAKFATAVSFASDLGLNYGEENVYEFEGERYYVGSEAVGSESFTTNDFKFLYKYAPLIIYHILNKFDLAQLSKPIKIKTGLAIVDWDKKDEFMERISRIEVNGNVIETEPTLIPQGAGSIIDWVHYNNDDEYPDSIVSIDIGYNTINTVCFQDGKPIRKYMKSYPGHGVSSVIKPFTSYLENTYAMTFSEQEAIKIFIKGKFKYNGEDQENVKEKIQEFKNQFIKKLFNSILVNDKKLLSTSDVVLIAGGGAYILQDVAFPPNVEFVENPYEFSNVRGYALS